MNSEAIKQSKREWLATKVMGWEVLKEWGANSPITGFIFLNKEDERMELDWNPLEDVEAAMEVLGKFPETALYHTTDRYEVQIDSEDHQTVIGECLHPSLLTAITEAALYASRYYEEPLQ